MVLLYIRTYKRKDGSISWSLETREYVKDTCKRTQIPKARSVTFGIPSELTFEQAKERAEQLNAQTQLKKDNAKKLAITQRLENERTEQLAFLPSPLIDEFESRFLAPKFQGKGKFDHKHKFAVKWRATLRTMNDIKLDPSDWFDNAFIIYNYLIEKQFSLNYCERIVALMNYYGFYYCKKYQKPFLAIPRLRGTLRQKQLNAYRKKSKRGIKSDPLTLAQLEAQKSKLLAENYNWLRISVAFGLRPEEIDRLKNRDTETAYKTSKQDGVTILHVYQSKLENSVDEDARWKLIPALYVDQKEALKIISSGNFRRPLTKTLQKYFTPRTTTYCGRKGFVDRMLAEEQSLENISQWLGHTSLDRTWADYKDRRVVHFKKPSPKKAA